MNKYRIENRLDRTARTLRAVVETPQGSRAKYTYDPECDGYLLSGVLPEGFTLPLDFGFVPRTVGEDGDPLDILVLNDAPAAVGTLIDVSIIGVIKGKQTEQGRTLRNDRIVAVASKSVRYCEVAALDQLGEQFVTHLQTFWVAYNDAKGKRYDLLGLGDADEAVMLIEQAGRRGSDD